QQDTVVVLSENERITSVHWQGNEPFDEEVEGTADRLTILHTRDAEDRVSIELLPVGAADIVPPLAVGSSYERAALRAGGLRLGVAAANDDTEHPRTLHVRTADRTDVAAAVLITAAGRIMRGTDLSLDAGAGTLLVPHAPGWVLSWIDRRGEEAQDLW